MEQPSLKDIEEVKKDFTIANKKLSSVKNEINSLVFGQNPENNFWKCFLLVSYSLIVFWINFARKLFFLGIFF